MDGFERAGVPSHKWREAGDSGSVRGSKKFALVVKCVPNSKPDHTSIEAWGSM